MSPIREVQHCPVCGAARPDLQLLCNACWWRLTEPQRLTLRFGSDKRRSTLLALIIRAHQIVTEAHATDRSLP